MIFQSEEEGNIQGLKNRHPLHVPLLRGYSTAKQKGNKKRRKIQEPDVPSQKQKQREFPGRRGRLTWDDSWASEVNGPLNWIRSE